jgi:hypothetical protein
MGLNTLEADNILRQIAYLKERTAKLESYFQGVPVSSMRIGKISASKLTAGTLHEPTILGEDSDPANRVTIDGEETRIMIRIAGTDQILIGKQVGGF